MPDQGRVIIVDSAGQRHVFPAGFDPKRAAGIVAQTTKAAPPKEPGLATIGDQVNAKWSDKLGLNAGTASPLVGFMRGAGAGVVDMAQGAVSNITGQLNAKVRAENEAATALPTPNATIPQKSTLPDVEAPANLSGMVGRALPTMAEMALPGGAPKALKVAKAAIPSTVRAGEKFEEVMGAAKDIPIEVKAVGDVSLRIMQLAERGASMPMAVRKLLVRMTDPEKAPMVYSESRDFASNIGRLSRDELGRLSPVVAREVAELSAKLNQANAQAARIAGKGAEYGEAMKEYARAMKLKDATDAVIAGAKKGVMPATLAGAGYWLTKKMYDSLSQ